MSPDEKKLFCEVLKGVKFPAGYASDIRHNVHVNERKVFGLKSHECHIVLQHLLPLAVRKVLPGWLPKHWPRWLRNWLINVKRSDAAQALAWVAPKLANMKGMQCKCKPRERGFRVQ